MKDKNIGGIEITLSIRFNSDDKRKYIDKYLDLHDNIADVIKNSGHILIATTGKPIHKKEFNEVR